MNLWWAELDLLTQPDHRYLSFWIKICVACLALILLKFLYMSIFSLRKNSALSVGCKIVCAILVIDCARENTLKTEERLSRELLRFPKLVNRLIRGNNLLLLFQCVGFTSSIPFRMYMYWCLNCPLTPYQFIYVSLFLIDDLILIPNNLSIVCTAVTIHSNPFMSMF